MGRHQQEKRIITGNQANVGTKNFLCIDNIL